MKKYIIESDVIRLPDGSTTYLKAGDWSRYNIGDEIEESEVEIKYDYPQQNVNQNLSYPKTQVAYLNNKAVVEEDQFAWIAERMRNIPKETRERVRVMLDEIDKEESLNSQK